MPAANIS